MELQLIEHDDEEQMFEYKLEEEVLKREQDVFEDDEEEHNDVEQEI